MEEFATTLILTEVYRRNLSALLQLDAACAKTIDNTPIPDFVVPLKGRDGSPTFHFRNPDHSNQSDSPNRPDTPNHPDPAQTHLRWFGGSSMPTISSEQLLSGFVTDGGSTALPGIFTGLEPLVLLKRMPRQAAVFVIEPDPLLLKLAMCLYDYGSLFETGRLVFITADDHTLDQALFHFFQTHPGYETPKHLQAVPLVPPARITHLQRALETLGSVVLQHQSELAQQHLLTLKNTDRGRWADRPRVMLVSLDTRREVHQLVRSMDRALSNLNWPHAVCLPDTPGQCHLVATLEAVVAFRADVVIAINSSFDSLGSAWPDDLPLLEWFFPDAIIPSFANSDPHTSMYRFATTKPVQSRMIQQGSNPKAIAICPVAADETVFHPRSIDDPISITAIAQIAILADLPDDRAESCGLNLRSHAELWHAAQNLAERYPDRYLRQEPDTLLSEAEKISGTTLTETPIRQHFHQMFQGLLIPAATARSCLHSLRGVDRSVAVWGRNWLLNDTQDAELWHGDIPKGEQLNDLFQTIGLVVLPSRSPSVLQTALHVLLSGKAVMLYEPGVNLGELFPDMDEVLPFLKIYNTTQELIRGVEEWLCNPSDTAKHLKRAREVLLEKHTIAARLRWLVNTVRPLKKPPSVQVVTQPTAAAP